MFAGYDDMEIGALDCEDIEGHVAPDSEILLQYADEFEKQKKEAVREYECFMPLFLIVIINYFVIPDGKCGKADGR